MFIHDLIDGLVALMNVEGDEYAAQDATAEQGQEELLKGVHGPVNIGNSNEFTIKELVEEVAIAVQQVRKELQRQGRGHLLPRRMSSAEEAEETPAGAIGTEMIGDVQVVYYPMPQDDPRQRRPNTTRAHNLLAWSPKWGLKEGLLEMARFYAQQLEEGTM